MSDVIECSGCGRSFLTDDPIGMLASIKGPCPSCGGTFQLATSGADTPAQQAPPAGPRWRG